LVAFLDAWPRRNNPFPKVLAKRKVFILRFRPLRFGRFGMSTRVVIFRFNSAFKLANCSVRNASQQRHNKALHPTAYSFARSSLPSGGG
jgi:hypothetical protein